MGVGIVISRATTTHFSWLLASYLVTVIVVSIHMQRHLHTHTHMAAASSSGVANTAIVQYGSSSSKPDGLKLNILNAGIATLEAPFILK